MATETPTRSIRLEQLQPRRYGHTHFLDDVYGAYYHEFLTVAYNQRESVDDLLRSLDHEGVQQFIKATPALDARVERALSDAVTLHEIRHFHDCFGTLAGLALFIDHMTMIDHFIDVCRVLYDKKITWQLPVVEWVDKASCPDEVKFFVRSFVYGQILRRVVLGMFGLELEQGPQTEIAAKFELPQITQLPDLHFLAYPTNLDRFELETGVSNVRTSWRPLGSEALLEGNAHALQRSVTASIWGEEVEREVWRRMTIAVVPEEEEESVDISGPYLVTDFMLTRYLGNKGIRTFARDLILDITDAALMESVVVRIPHGPDTRIASPRTSMTSIFRHPGRAFVDILDRVSWHTGSMPKAGAPPSTQMHTGNSLDKMRDLTAGIPAPDQLFARRTYVHGHEAVLSFAIHNIVQPILSVRNELGDSVFRTIDGYGLNASKLPVPPIMLLKSGIVKSRDVTDALLQKWGEYVMVSQMMNALMNITPGAPLGIFCPKAVEGFPGARFLDFARGQRWQVHIENKSCMRWSPGRLTELPSCLFRSLIETLGIENPHRGS